MRKRQLTISALNIVVDPPHEAERYSKLIKSVFRYKQTVRLIGDHVALLGSCRTEKLGKENIVFGQIYKFFDLDPNTKWFNIELRKPADDGELSEIQIPANLKPHFQILDYVLFPRKHKMFFLCKDRNDRITPAQVQKLMVTLFGDSRVTSQFGRVSVTIEPARQALESILSLQYLKRLRIELRPPNPDDLDEAEKRIFGELDEQRASHLVTELVSEDDSGLKPSDDTRVLAEIAQSNGVVNAHGRDDQGFTVDISTKDHPLLEKFVFDPNTQTKRAAFIEKALELLTRLM